MPHTDRKELYKKLTEIRGRALITYFTSYRRNASGSIAADVIPDIIKHINCIPIESKEIDLLIVSYGGDPTVAYRIVNILRERFKKFSVILPFAAYSAATLISLGADEIVMHPFSNLGPVDPQLSYKKNDEVVKFGSEDLRNFIDYIRKDVGISDQEQMQRSFNLVCKEIGAIPIGIAKRSSQLALTMGEKLLSLHLKDQNKAKTIAESLNKSFYHHGYPLSRSEAKIMGLPVTDAKPDEEKIIWSIFESFERDMELNVPFDPLMIVLNNEAAKEIISPTLQVNIPNNLPKDLLQNIYSQILQQVKVIEIPPIDYELFQAAVETENNFSSFRTKGKILATKQMDNSISVNVIPTSSRWSFNN